MSKWYVTLAWYVTRKKIVTVWYVTLQHVIHCIKRRVREFYIFSHRLHYRQNETPFISFFCISVCSKHMVTGTAKGWVGVGGRGILFWVFCPWCFIVGNFNAENLNMNFKYHIFTFVLLFYAPGLTDRVCIVFDLSVRLSVIPSVTKFNNDHKMKTLGTRFFKVRRFMYLNDIYPHLL